MIDLLGLNEPRGPRYTLPYYNAMIYRKRRGDLLDLINKSKKLYPLFDPAAQFNHTDNVWKFSSGSQVHLKYFERYDVAETFLQGQELAAFCADELASYEDDRIFKYAMSRLRNSDGLRVYARGTCNPSRHKWVREYWRIDAIGSATDFTEDIELSDGSIVKKRIKFIPARLSDNIHLPKEYQAQLMLLPRAEREALANGRWDSFDTVENQVYESELKQLIEENRFCVVRHDPSVAVSTYFDLGINDEMVILFVQHVGKEIRIINMLHGRNKGLEEYWIPEINKLGSEKNYQYAKHYLPHDAKQRDKFDATSIESKMKSRLGNVEVLQRSSLIDGIQSTRSMFPNVWIDKVNCQDLLDGLQKYIRETDSNGNLKATPIHSDIADAFRYVSYASPKKAIADITPGKSASPFTFTR